MKETNSQESTVCPACGKPLSPESPQGLCGTCLMIGALEPTLDKEEIKAPANSSGKSSPKLEDIQKAFPQFEVIELIGAGGMGAVYKARQPKLDRVVALKILTVADRDDRFTERFQLEAKTLARLSHPNIVTIYDYGETDGLYFLLMEYVEGLNLRQIMGASRLAPAQALAIVPPICEALQYAHDLGIVHRDIKPDNILMDQSGRVKIADFGIARLLGDAGDELPKNPSGGDPDVTSLTQEMILGTPNYMAPEQISAPETVDHRADIYSLGVVIYEMLTGERPGSALTPPSDRVEIDVRLDQVVLQALAKQPEMRFQSADEFTRTLARATAESLPPNEPKPLVKPPVQLSKRRPWITAGAVLLVLAAVLSFSGLIEILLMAIVGVITFALLSRRSIPASSPFSRLSRALLSAVAVPAIVFIVVTLTNLVSMKTDQTRYRNELVPPESRRFTVDRQTVIAIDDKLRTHYVFHFDGDITSVSGMSQGGGAREPQHWSRNGTLALPSGKRIEYLRESTKLSELSIDGKTWDLRDGAVFQVKADGSVVQLPLYPPLLREENVEEWLGSLQ